MTTSGPRRVPPAGLAAECARPLLDDEGRVDGALVVVDLDGERGDVTAAAEAAAAGERLLLGWAPQGADPALLPLVRALDLTLVPAGTEAAEPALVGTPDPVAALAAALAAAAATPAAATVLAGLLRWTGGLPVPAALEAESLARAALLGGAEFAAWRAERAPAAPDEVAEPVRVERGADVLRVTLHRPARRNAVDGRVRTALGAALTGAERDPAVVRVVLDGEGPAFCAGTDLGELARGGDPVADHLARVRAGAALPLSRLGSRVVAELHGDSVGPGIELAAFAGRVVAALDTRVRLPDLAAGLVPGDGGTVSLPRRIGRWRTLYLALTGEEVDAGTALAWGLVDEVR